MSEETTSEAAPAQEPAPQETPQEMPEVPEVPTDARDKTNAIAGDKEDIPVDSEGDKEERNDESREKMQQWADEIRKTQKEQRKAAEAQRGTAEQNELVETRSGSFGEVRGIMPKYKAEVDGYKYKPIRRSRLKEWAHKN